MIRVFLKLYLLLILPLVLLTLLPQSPIHMLGQWWFEKSSYREFGAIYHLVKEELDTVPKSEWGIKVESIGEHFAYPLFLKKRNEADLKQEEFDKLDSQGYAMVKHNFNNTLAFSVEDSDYILYASLWSRANMQEMFEKNTRGYRYFLNKKIRESKNPIAEFKTSITKYFPMDLNMYTLEEFKNTDIDKNLLANLIKTKTYRDLDISEKSYLLSEDSKYVVEISQKVSAFKAVNKRFYKILLFLIPALLLAFGALIWIYLYRSEFKKVNNVAMNFGDGDLSSRIKLSKNSSLYPISESFNVMAARIQKLVNGQQELTNAVSHELKTPLSRLHYALELQKTSNTLEEREKYTDKIEDNIASLEALVDELLTYTRLQTTRSLNLKSYKIKAWLKKELDVFSEYHPTVKVSLDCDYSNQSMFDKLLLSRALNNLLENAAHYADANHPEIKVTSTFKDNKTIIDIEDNGKGIKESDRIKIFEPFTRLDPSRQRHNKNKSLGGYGIGLSIVESVMQQHKGEVFCSDSSLGGAKITLIW